MTEDDKHDEMIIVILSEEVHRLRKMLSDLGFCYKDGEAMPCFECGAGL